MSLYPLQFGKALKSFFFSSLERVWLHNEHVRHWWRLYRNRISIGRGKLCSVGRHIGLISYSLLVNWWMGRLGFLQ